MQRKHQAFLKTESLQKHPERGWQSDVKSSLTPSPKFFFALLRPMGVYLGAFQICRFLGYSDRVQLILACILWCVMHHYASSYARKRCTFLLGEKFFSGDSLRKGSWQGLVLDGLTMLCALFFISIGAVILFFCSAIVLELCISCYQVYSVLSSNQLISVRATMYLFGCSLLCTLSGLLSYFYRKRFYLLPRLWYERIGLLEVLFFSEPEQAVVGRRGEFLFWWINFLCKAVFLSILASQVFLYAFEDLRIFPSWFSVVQFLGSWSFMQILSIGIVLESLLLCPRAFYGEKCLYIQTLF